MIFKQRSSVRGRAYPSRSELGPALSRAMLLRGNEESVIGSFTLFRGQIRGQGSFTVRGQVEGQVGIDGGLTVDRGGRLQADTWVTEAVVAGSVLGSVHARRRLAIASTGILEGNARAGQLRVEEGAVLKGKVLKSKSDA